MSETRRLERGIYSLKTGAMVYRKPADKLPWRDFLTEDERAILATADAAKTAWLELNRERAAITNRAIHRAKYHQQRE